MSSYRTLTLRCRYPIVNCSEVLFVENKMNKQAGKCVRIRAGTHLRHQLTFRNHANVMYRWSSEIACNELTQNWTEPHNIKKWEKITPIPSLDWKQDSKHGLKGNMLFLKLEMLLLFAMPILFVRFRSRKVFSWHQLHNLSRLNQIQLVPVAHLDYWVCL